MSYVVTKLYGCWNLESSLIQTNNPNVLLVVEPFKLDCYLKRVEAKVVQLHKKQSHTKGCVIFQCKHQVCHSLKQQHPWVNRGNCDSTRKLFTAESHLLLIEADMF